MCDRSHHAVRRSARQFGVRIERNYVSDVRKDRKIADLYRKAVELPSHQPIEIKEFSALALPAHPSLFAGVVDPMAMEKEKGAHVLSGVSLVEIADQFFRQLNQSIVFGRGLSRIRKIGNEREVQIAIVITQKTDF